jgi:rhamnose transport system substrate-binding protein
MLGKVKLDTNGSGAIAEPFVYDVGNIDKFSKIFSSLFPPPQGRG